ncbi:MAG: hypothetical protein KDA99_06065, partial [Planctomycetales bacterium]|nr:hypothetical protein [Planctomycetales bacterium]
MLAGTGIVNTLYGGDGDDQLHGSPDGTNDPDLFDTIYFGDLLFGDAGNDRIYGSGGADIVDGGDGDDFVDGGSHGDLLRGGNGRDELHGGGGDDWLEGQAEIDLLYGEFGADRLIGGLDPDFLDGGSDTDHLQGNEGDDHLRGGGGVNDLLEGGPGNDHLEGSDDGADLLIGGAGDDWIEGFGGNDALQGDSGDDRLEGGAGDDFLQGGAGSDFLVGGAQHDTLFGHTQSGTGDDNAVDYLYGDHGSTDVLISSGQDQLFGGGGNDFLFGESGDDLIDAGGGNDDRVDFGLGEGPDPTTFVSPAPTSKPAVVPSIDPARFAATLSAGPAEGGRWSQLGSSASHEGIAGRITADAAPSLAIDSIGRHWIAWSDSRSGNPEIYVSRYESDAWGELGGSASGGGVSQSVVGSRQPQLAVDDNDRPWVAWIEGANSQSDVRLARFNSATGAWEALGNSLEVGGISQSGTVTEVVAAFSDLGPVVAWIEQTGPSRSIRARQWDGVEWQDLGDAPVATANGTADLSLAVDGTRLAIAWSQPSDDSRQIFVKQFQGTSWTELDASASAGGVSASVHDDSQPSVAWFDNELFVAWRRETLVNNQQRSHILVRRFDGTTWLDAGIQTDSPNITAGSVRSTEPTLTSGSSGVALAWVEDLARIEIAERDGIYHMVWDGEVFAPEFTASTDASGIGVSTSGGEMMALTSASDAAGRTAIAWIDSQEGSPSLYVRSNFSEFDSVTHVSSSGQIQALIDSASLPSNALVVLEPGNYSSGIRFTASASGATFLGSAATRIAGDLVVDGAANITIQNFEANSLILEGGSHATIRDSRLQMTIARGGTNHRLSQVHMAGGTIGLEVEGPVVNLTVIDSRIEGTETGISVDAPSDLMIQANGVWGGVTGIVVNSPMTGAILDNVIGGDSIGLLYLAEANVSSNRIENSAIGVQVGDSGPEIVTLTFGAAPDSMANVIRNNDIGVDLRQGMIGQTLIGNPVGVIGPGQLGGEDWQSANRIIGSAVVGSRLSGRVQFNEFIDNRTAIEVADKQLVAHNTVAGDGLVGIVAIGAHDARILQNTVHQRVGDAIRLVASSSEIEVRGNTLWVDAGTALMVDDSSQAGLASDYNQLHAESGAILVHYSLDFVDLLDWQEDVAKFDLHSIGTTVVHPLAAKPRVQSVPLGQYVFAPP